MGVYTKIALTLFVALMLTVCLFSVLEKGQRRYHIHKYGRLNKIFEDTTSYDILFIGSSRTHTGVYPKVIDSLTGLKSFNAGVEGGNLYEFKLTLDGYLVHHPALRFLFLAIDGPSFEVKKKMFFPLQYFDNLDNLVIKRSFQEQSGYSTFLIEKLPFLRLIYQDDYAKGVAVQGLFNTNEISKFKLFEHEGFLSNGYECVDTAGQQTHEKKYLKIEEEGIGCLKAMMDTCKARGIRLAFTYAPEYKGKLQASFEHFPLFINAVKNEASANGIPFYRDDSLPMCQLPCFFANYGHVNTRGAVEYSAILGKRIAGTQLQNKQ